VQAHTLGEVAILGTVLLRVSSGTIALICSEIGLYLTDKEQKISWHRFFGTWCINKHLIKIHVLLTYLLSYLLLHGQQSIKYLSSVGVQDGSQHAIQIEISASAADNVSRLLPQNRCNNIFIHRKRQSLKYKEKT